jgi:hypothetical protein
VTSIIGLETAIDWAVYPEALSYDVVAGYVGDGPSGQTWCLANNVPFPGAHDPGLPVEPNQVMYYLTRSNDGFQNDTWGFDSFGDERNPGFGFACAD